MRLDWTTGLLCAGAIALGGLAPACSCGDDGNTPAVDGSPGADAPIDGTEITATRAGTILFAQVSVVDAELEAATLDVRGADFTVAFDDLTTLGVAPSFEGNPDGINGCTVFEFPGPGMEAAEVDEGPVAVTGFGDIGDFNCAFASAGAGYQCAPAADATGSVGTGASLTDANMGTSVFTLATADFTAINGGSARGMAITFPTGTWPGNPTNDGTYPIVDVLAATQAVLGHPGAIAEVLNEQTQDYNLTIGSGPIRQNAAGPYHIFAGNNGPFTIAGGSDETGPLEAFSEEITPATITNLADAQLDVRLVDGAGADLGPFLPGALPTAEFAISCDTASGGNCESGSPVSALIVSGRTTDGVLPATGDPIADETAMPEPVGTYTTFTCVFLGQKTGTISQEALDAIHAGNPTRIETRVIYASGVVNTEEDGDRVRLLSGYGLVGFTDL